MANKKTMSPIIIATSISLIGNAILSILKIITGFVSGSFAVLSDGIDSASDVAISLIMLITARIVSKPPNKKYAYGYGRAESIATKALSFIILFTGGQMFIASIKAIFRPEVKVIPSSLAIYITIISIIVKLFLALYQTRTGKKHKSSMLIANGINMRNDVLISLSVLIGLIFTFIFKLPILDSITALIVSVYIIRSAVIIFIESSTELMDGIKDVSLYEKIFKAVLEVKGVRNPHKVRIHSLGNKYSVVLDIEVDGDIPLRQAHDISQLVEKNIKKNIPEIYDIIIHVEPAGESHEIENFGINL